MMTSAIIKIFADLLIFIYIMCIMHRYSVLKYIVVTSGRLASRW